MRVLLAVLLASTAARAEPPMAGTSHDHTESQSSADTVPGMDMSHDHAMPGMDLGHDHMAMPGAFGPYTGTREASGTSWQPDVSTHEGLHTDAGGWMLMLHGRLNLAYTSQSGRRGDDKLFVSGHIVGMAQRDLSNRDRIQFRLAVSPDPFMGARGYPLLLASGETADGRTQLVDRQHPHELISELSASVSHKILGRGSVSSPISGYARRAGVRAARLCPPPVDHGQSGGPDHSSLARQHTHQ